MFIKVVYYIINKMVTKKMRVFNGGAVRESDDNKYDYEGFLSPLVLERFGEYMHKHRVNIKGKTRDPDDWQKGVPLSVYMKSSWRHFMDIWLYHRKIKIKESIEDSLCGLMFNVMGYLHVILGDKTDNNKSS